MKNQPMQDEKLVKAAISAITVGLLILAAVLFTKGNIEKKVASEPIRSYVVDRECQFVKPPVQGGMWAACDDGTSWGVVPLEAGQPGE